MDRFPKATAPSRRVVRTVWLDRDHFYDVLDCGHNENGQYTAARRRCRTCAYPDFPGVPTRAQSRTPVEVDDSSLRGPGPTLPPPLPPRTTPVPAPEPPAFLTVREAADLLRVDQKTIYRGLATREIPGGRKIRGTHRISRRILLAWLEAETVPGKPLSR